MAYRRLFAGGALALGLVLTFLWLARQPAQGTGAATLCSDDYDTLQDAIDKAGSGDVIHVEEGEYYETLVISESVTLQGGWSPGCTVRATTDPSKTPIDGDGQGPVVWITDGSPTLDGLTITGGQSNRGAGVRIEGVSPTLANVVVSGNTLTTTVYEYIFGAGVYVDATRLTLSHCEIVSNVAYAYPGRSALGAGLYVESVSDRLVLIATRIEHNGPAGGAGLLGGGIYAWAGDDLVFVGTENRVAYNRAEMGGGIYARGHLSGTVVLSNTATLGAGVYLHGHPSIMLVNNVIAGNTADTAGSGILITGGGQIVNNTIVGNVGAGVDIDASGTPVITLTNNIIVGHKTGIRNQHTTVSPTLATNDLWGNDANYAGVLTGTTDVHVDPGFVDPAGGDYHLAGASPLIDAGTTVDWLTVDFDGDPRPIGASHDIGADEWGRFVYLPLVTRAYAP